ncbi:hypothetical protein M3Y99_01086900 [Aphelenchoides fujianensis]|nr:hypothetical protein M3Y99_01086900 [Aphelenchoides fujianensis]
MNETFFGATVAIYAIGQILSSPLFGWWSNRKGVQPPLIVGLLLMLLGNMAYISMEAIHFVPKRFILAFARFITGAGSGNVSVLRSYASTASTNADRTKAIAYVTLGQSLGMVSGPVFQILFLKLEHPGVRIFDVLSLSLYTGPAYCACFYEHRWAACSLYFLFNEHYAGIIEEQKPGDAEAPPTPAVPKYDRLAVFVCYCTRFIDMLVRSTLEAIGSPFGMAVFALREAEVVSYNAWATGILGGLTFATYLLYIFFRLERFIKLRFGCIAALCGLVAFHLITFAWPFLPSTVQLASPSSNLSVGCDAKRFSWCANLPAVPVWLYYGSYALIVGLSFPMLTISLNSLFSKVLGPIKQGTEQGLLQVSSGVARMVGPLGASYLYVKYGPQAVWLMEIGAIGLVLFAWIGLYRRMVPLRLTPELQRALSSKRSISRPSSVRKNSKQRVHPV